MERSKLSRSRYNGNQHNSRNEGSNPKQVVVESVVENPSIFGTPGSPVTVTWEPTDPESNSKGSNTEQILMDNQALGFDLNFPDQGVHDLTVTIDRGQTE